MSEEKYDIERIDRYLKGMLEEKELQEFETQMGADPDLITEVALQKDIMIGAEAYFDAELKGKLQQIDREPNEVDAGGKQIFFKPWKTAAIAASILLLFTVGYFVFFNQPNMEQLYLSSYEAYPNIVSPIQRSNNSIESDALSHYERGDYSTATKLFDEELEQNPNEDYLLFYCGLSNLEVGETDQAIALLKKITPAADSRFYAPAQWYLALAYLKAQDIAALRKQLEEVISEKGDYQPRAQKLLDEL